MPSVVGLRHRSGCSRLASDALRADEDLEVAVAGRSPHEGCATATNAFLARCGAASAVLALRRLEQAQYGHGRGLGNVGASSTELLASSTGGSDSRPQGVRGRRAHVLDELQRFYCGGGYRVERLHDTAEFLNDSLRGQHRG